LIDINQTEDSDFKVDDQGVLRFRGRICIPDNDEMKKMILEESHRSRLSIHPGATKMYHDLKKLFWWSGLKRDVTQFVYSCLTCQKSKVKHQKPVGLMTPIDVPEWKWDSICNTPYSQQCKIIHKIKVFQHIRNDTLLFIKS